jgi:DNA-binding NarL/FixJ family response regulator
MSDEVRPVSVLVADDHPYFLEAAREVFATMRGYEVVGEVGSGEQAVDAVDELRPDLALLDVRMAGLGGIEAARLIKERHPEVVVFLISMEEPSDVSEQAERCGASALLRKQDFGPSEVRRLWSLHGDPASSAHRN